MTWHDLLFAHWPVSAELLEAHIPKGLVLQTWEGMAWIGVVPFGMKHVGPRGLNRLPGLPAFPELNLRTYVEAEDKPGVWFFSLDAANLFAVRAARAGFYLPYMDARMKLEQKGEEVLYSSIRTHRGEPPAEFYGRYRPTGPVYGSKPGSLEHWLTERYCLYSADAKGKIYRGEIHHPPWPLQPAEAEIEVNTMTEPLGFGLPAQEPLLHFARSIETVAWWPERVNQPER
jgi:hypothetical protein